MACDRYHCAVDIPGTPYADIARAYFKRGFERRTNLDEKEYVRARVAKHFYPDEGDYEFQHGNDLWLLISDRKTPSGGVIGFRLDITRRKRAEMALFESEQRFKSLLEMSSDWYWEQDSEFGFTYLSEGHTHHVGVDKSERIGKRRWEIGLHGVTPEQWQAHRHDLERHLTFRNFEYAWFDTKGREIFISISGDPVIDPAGAFVGYRGVGTDTTRRHVSQQVDGTKSIQFLPRGNEYARARTSRAGECPAQVRREGRILLSLPAHLRSRLAARR